MIWAKPHYGYTEVEMAGFNTLTRNLITVNLLTGNVCTLTTLTLTTKNSAGVGCPPIEKADQTHKRDLFGEIGQGKFD
jgi:hypothetical protein